MPEDNVADAAIADNNVVMAGNDLAAEVARKIAEAHNILVALSGDP